MDPIAALHCTRRLWHKLFPDGSASIECASSTLLGSKFGTSTWLPAANQDLFIDFDSMAKDIVPPLRDVEAIRREFDCNGVDEKDNHENNTEQNDTEENNNDKNDENNTDIENITDESNDVENNVLSQGAASNALRDITNVPCLERATYTSKSKRSVPGKRSSKAEHCVFCRNNGTPPHQYKSHVCHDERGLVSCPALQKMVCPFCKATGVYAHTPKYCPQKPIITPEDCKAWEAEGRGRSYAKKDPTDKENTDPHSLNVKDSVPHKTFMSKAYVRERGSALKH